MAKAVLSGGPEGGREMDLPDGVMAWQCAVYREVSITESLSGPLYVVATYMRSGDVRLYEDQTWRWIYKFTGMEDRQ